MTTQFRCLDTGAPLTVARRDFRRLEHIDEYPDLSWLEDAAGRERLDAFREGCWHMIGIQAGASFLIPLGGHLVSQSVTSPGLWGIESDSDEAYLDAVYAEECANLAAMLAAIGVTVTA
jgi:hypothetical protein